MPPRSSSARDAKVEDDDFLFCIPTRHVLSPEIRGMLKNVRNPRGKPKVKRSPDSIVAQEDQPRALLNSHARGRSWAEPNEIPRATRVLGPRPNAAHDVTGRQLRRTRGKRWHAPALVLASLFFLSSTLLLIARLLFIAFTVNPSWSPRAIIPANSPRPRRPPKMRPRPRLRRPLMARRANGFIPLPQPSHSGWSSPFRWSCGTRAMCCCDRTACPVADCTRRSGRPMRCTVRSTTSTAGLPSTRAMVSRRRRP